MDAAEIAWLDAYHARVRKTLSPRVDRVNPRLAREGHAAARRGQDERRRLRRERGSAPNPMHGSVQLGSRTAGIDPRTKPLAR